LGHDDFSLGHVDFPMGMMKQFNVIEAILMKNVVF